MDGENELAEMFKELIEAQIQTAPKMAKAIRKMVECLEKEGFTREEAIEIVKGISIKSGK